MKIMVFKIVTKVAANIVFFFRAYVQSVFCQHIYRVKVNAKDFVIYECTNCWKTEVVEKLK
jgi:hypothetical protein